MKFLSDERGQGAAEYILLFGGVIVIAIAALVIYNSYFNNQTFNTEQDINTTRTNSSCKQQNNYKIYIKDLNFYIFVEGMYMKFLSDETGQGAAEYILLFGGVIVIAIAALVIYNSYFTNQTFNTATRC